jgi:hypothetical protein
LKIYAEGKCVQLVIVVKSLCKRDPTVFWNDSTKKFCKLIFDSKELSETSGKPVKIGEIRENPKIGNARWTTNFILIGEHDIRHISSIIRKISDDIDPENVVLVGRKCFLENFRSVNDRTDSRYHWSGNNHPFGWLMYMDKKGEHLDDLLLSEVANEIGSVFMTNFEKEMINGRLQAAKRKA